MRYDENGGLDDDFSMLAWLKKLWEEDVNSACAGTHDFKINMPNNVARVIDLYKVFLFMPVSFDNVFNE